MSAIDHLKNLLRRIIRISTSDGRVFIGSLAGTDQALNVILVNAEEFRLWRAGWGKGEMDSDAQGRYVGQVVVPWRFVLKVEVEGTAVPKDDDRASPAVPKSNGDVLYF